MIAVANVNIQTAALTGNGSLVGSFDPSDPGGTFPQIGDQLVFVCAGGNGNSIAWSATTPTSYSLDANATKVGSNSINRVGCAIFRKKADGTNDIPTSTIVNGGGAGQTVGFLLAIRGDRVVAVVDSPWTPASTVASGAIAVTAAANADAPLLVITAIGFRGASPVVTWTSPWAAEGSISSAGAVAIGGAAWHRITTTSSVQPAASSNVATNVIAAIGFQEGVQSSPGIIPARRNTLGLILR